MVGYATLFFLREIKIFDFLCNKSLYTLQHYKRRNYLIVISNDVILKTTQKWSDSKSI